MPKNYSNNNSLKYSTLLSKKNLVGTKMNKDFIKSKIKILKNGLFWWFTYFVHGEVCIMFSNWLVYGNHMKWYLPYVRFVLCFLLL